METLGSLVDKLSIVNIKLYHLEEIRHNMTKPDKERLEASDKIAVLNKQRNLLMDEINEQTEKFIALVVSGKKLVDLSNVKLY